MSNTSKAIVAGNSGNIRIGGGSHGQNEDIVIYGQDIEKGSFVKFVNYPSASSVFSDDAEPDNDDIYYENVKPAYVRISDDIVVKFWHDKPFGTSLVAYDSYSYQFNGTSNYNINVHAKWYKIIDNKIDWSSGKKVLFPEITKSPDLFNETGTNVIKVYNYHIYTYDESKNTYVEELDPTGKAYDDGVFPFAVNSGYWAEDKDNAYVEDLSIELQQNGRVNVIVSYGLHSHHDANPYRDVVYENCRIISFNFEYDAQLDEVTLRKSNFTQGCGTGYQSGTNPTKNFLYKQYGDLIALGTQYANDPFGYSSDNTLTIDDIPYKGATTIKYIISDETDSLSIAKIGPAFSFHNNFGMRSRPCNEGFSCRKKDRDNIYSIMYVGHGGTTTDSKGYGDNDTIYNSLELQLNDTALAVISNAPSAHYNDYTANLDSCFVDLCIMSKGADDIILTAHQNNDKIYLNIYKHHIYTGSVTLTSQATIDCNNTNKNTGLFYGSITIQKIDNNHVLLIKNATTSISSSDEILDNAKIYLITTGTNYYGIDVANLSISSENAKLVTSLSNIKIIDYKVITGASATSTKTYDYYAVDIMNILTGIPVKIGIEIDRSTKTTATISNSVYETTERVQKTSLPYEVEGVSRQAGKHGDMIRVTKRI